MKNHLTSIGLLLFACMFSYGQDKSPAKFEYLDIFDLEYVSDPRISPNGSKVIYVRNFKDVMSDRNLSNLWIVNFDGSDSRPLTTGIQNDFSPRWSPDGKKVLYKSRKDGNVQFYLRWLDTGAEAKLTNLTQSSGSPYWSPDGRYIVFSMFVASSTKPLVTLPSKPEGAKWNDPPIYIDKMNYRADGAGYLKEGYRQLFLLSTDGGTPRQLTTGDFNHGGTVSWTPDNKNILFSANRHEDGEFDPRNSEVYRLNVANGSITSLTNRQGPDNNPVISPDGTKIAYLGFDDRYQGYQVTRLYVMNADGSGKKLVSGGFDRDVGGIHWASDNKGVYFQYTDQGIGKIAFMSLTGKVKDLTVNVGGLSIGRPYSGGSYTVSSNDRYTFTLGESDHPADLATGSEKGGTRRLTQLNNDLFDYKKLGSVEEIWYESAFDGRKIQGWICKPPDFDPSKKYPLILEIHGGPFAAYGPWFTAEIQLYASAGYVVLYTNPRGSTSYGEEFGNLIHHAYPGNDFDDLMSGVDAIIENGYIDDDNLFVTGGSGGGVLTAWIVGHTNRFRAAVVAKPVINWYSFVLYSDGPAFFYKYWFPGLPWDNTEHYMQRSPISYVGNVKTPTMILTGESDFRTPIAETEQFYAALKLNKVESAMVRIPGASHGIAAKPSNLIAKVAYIVGWFEKFRQKDDEKTE